MLASFRVVARNPVYLAYLALATTSYAGLFAWISGASFVLQNLYGLTPFRFGVAFALGSLGYMVGSTLSARLVRRLGLDGIIGIGGMSLTAGGLGMTAAVALGFTSALSLVLPMAVYLAGLGMVLPQSIAGALTPFPDRAGAASSLLGFIQQSVAAACGAIGRRAARPKRLAARWRCGGHGPGNAADMDRDARRARSALPSTSPVESAAAEQIVEHPAVEAGGAVACWRCRVTSAGGTGAAPTVAGSVGASVAAAAEQAGEQAAAGWRRAGRRPARPGARRA